ncbi:Glycosyl phosphatidyl inositol anchor synthesis, partial [Dimargaris xerosporica]
NHCSLCTMLASKEALLILGVVFHVVYLWSIFDIYFRSPLVHGMTPHAVPSEPPAKRLFLFVADGLRADKIYEPFVNTTDAAALDRDRQGEYLAPYLHGVIRNQGSWGVSHTRVPTESRPGHVALIAGFYEDVSAVTKGWKMNPVNFDSTFNQSRHTWSFGSPDILPMFAHGASRPEHVETFMYGHEDEDFAADGAQLDHWVFDQVNALFDRATTNQTLREQLHKSQIVFFLHLLGLDTNGHAHRPHSPEYLNNIRIVDRGIKQIVARVEKFFDYDDKTAYVFTADHGMNNRGVHGDGHPDNTRTPLIAWGAGVQKPQQQPVPAAGHDDFSAHWGLSQWARKDVAQADIAPLMTSLIGVPFPLNSVGTLPLEYLDNTPEFKAQCALANAHQILAQYQVKRDAKQATQLFFHPFKALTNATHHPDVLIPQIQQLMAQQRYDEAIAKCQALIGLALDGLQYFQTYDWLFLRSTVTAGYVGWVFYCLLFVLQNYVVGMNAPITTPAATAGAGAKLLNAAMPQLRPASQLDTTRLVLIHVLNTLALLVLGALFALLYLQDSPALYYAYTAFPVFFWCQVLKHWSVFGTALVPMSNQGPLVAKSSPPHSHSRSWAWVGGTVAYLAVLELLVVSYFYRAVLSAGFVVLSTWPYWSHHPPSSASAVVPWRAIGWTIACLCTAIFTLLPVEKGEDLTLILAGSGCVLASGLVALAYRHVLFRLPSEVATSDTCKPQGTVHAERFYTALLSVQVGLVALTGGVVCSTVQSLTQKQGLPWLNQVVAWTVLVLSPTVPLLVGLRSRQSFLHRLVTIYLALAPPFILLSISYEVLFYFCFCGLLFLSLFLEADTGAQTPFPTPLLSVTKADVHAYRALALGDLRTAAQFLFLVNVGFFGTGNVASISSFSLEAVYRLTTIFDPFVMGALLIFKILIPFFLLSAVLGIVNRIKNLPPMAMFLLVLATTDIMTLNFFYLVKDTGSWLEIGTTISHFCIASLFVLFVIVLYLVSQVFTAGTVVPMASRLLRHKAD